MGSSQEYWFLTLSDVIVSILRFDRVLSSEPTTSFRVTRVCGRGSNQPQLDSYKISSHYCSLPLRGISRLGLVVTLVLHQQNYRGGKNIQYTGISIHAFITVIVKLLKKYLIIKDNSILSL